MSRKEIYPWSLLCEVGDYFMVPVEFKSYEEVKRYVSVKNSLMKYSIRYDCVKNDNVTVVMLMSIMGELPPYEYINEYGIMCNASRRDTLRAAKAGEETVLGVKPTVPKRTQAQIIARMSAEERQANLPWWYDPSNGKLLVNTRLIKEPEGTLFHENKFRPSPEAPYPEHYNLDENLRLKTREQQWDEEDEEDFGEGFDVN